jgi:hypothetical protein
VLDRAGSIFGTTAIGGNKICQDAHGKPIGCGIVFQLRAPAKKGGAWTEKILHRFTDGNDGLVRAAVSYSTPRAHFTERLEGEEVSSMGPSSD